MMKQVSSGWLHSPLPTSLKVLRVVYEHDLRQRVPNYCERVHEQVELAAVDDAVVVPPPAVPVVGLRQKRGGGGGEVGPRVSTFEGSQGLPRARGSALSRALKGSQGLEGRRDTAREEMHRALGDCISSRAAHAGVWVEGLSVAWSRL